MLTAYLPVRELPNEPAEDMDGPDVMARRTVGKSGSRNRVWLGIPPASQCSPGMAAVFLFFLVKIHKSNEQGSSNYSVSAIGWKRRDIYKQIATPYRDFSLHPHNGVTSGKNTNGDV